MISYLIVSEEEEKSVFTYVLIILISHFQSLCGRRCEEMKLGK